MKTTKFINKIKELVGEEYTVLGEYINANTKILMRHNCDDCNNHEWEVKPKKFTSDGTRCPVCSKNKRIKGDVTISTEKQSEIIDMYTNQKLSIKKIATNVGLSVRRVTAVLNNNNIVIDGALIVQKYTDQQILDIADEYTPGSNMYELSDKYNIPVATLQYRFSQLGIETTKRKHTLNESYFENIDTQNKAYILGFLMADGCVSKTDKTQLSTNRLIVSISKKDRQVLEFIKNELECDYEIFDFIPSGTYANHEMSRLSINSKQLCSDLAKYGIVPRKTGSESFPILDREYQRHFIRGFLDGDGFVTNKGKAIGFCSNRNMLTEILNVLKTEFDIKSIATIRDDEREKPLSYMQINCKGDIENLKFYLYNNANFYLERKYSKLT